MRAAMLIPVAAGCALAAPLAAQPPCSSSFAPAAALAGADGDVYLSQPWDPDGTGPLPELLVLGGKFRTAGNLACSNVAAYEPSTGTWLALGNGLPGDLTALAADGTGRLVAATLGSLVFEWNGSSWVQLGPQLGNTFFIGVSAVALLATGEVIAGGTFQGIGGAPIHGIARWNGTAWLAMGNPTTPFLLGSVERLQRLPNGDLIAAGLFLQIGGVNCDRIARFDGSQWHPVGQGVQNASRLIADTAGNLVAIGSFATPTGTATLARWNGSTWIDVGQGLPASPTVLAPLPGGALLVQSGGAPWSNASGTWTQFAPWSASTAAPGGAFTFHAWAGNDVLATGRFAPTALVPARNVARWNGTAWAPPNRGTDGPITAVAALADGGYLVGGNLAQVDGTPCNRFARLVGSTWIPVASSATAAPRRMLARPDGSAVVIGTFPNATTGGLDFVMEWNGSQLQPIGTGLWGTRLVQQLGLAANGDALLSYQELFPTQGGFARWDGSTLHFTGLPGSFPQAITGLPGGEVLLSGTHQIGGSNVELARWNGTQLTPFGAPLNGLIRALAVLPNGDVLAGGSFTQPAHIARWDGTAWQPLGAGLPYPVASLAVLPNGVVVAGTIRQPGNVIESTVHRWSGSGWTLLAETQGRADVVKSPSGTVVVHGEFVQAAGAVQAYFAQLVPGCPASVLDRGGGCVGSAGPVTLVAREPAWLASTLATEARGLPTPSLALSVHGFASWSLPLSLLHPAGVPGCSLLATGDLVQLLPSSGGIARPVLAIPNAPALVGASFEHQVLGLELDGLGNVTAITGSNALQFVLGAL
ncbi:MAG: hypothetical protein MUC36_06355 [Planctomycetes bacterium]|nr:hypothetical protein [Planctomycetota bacterium]